MPKPIATFISEHVYDRRLLSEHSIGTPDCFAFIDASRIGEDSVGSSSRVRFVFCATEVQY